VVGVDAGTVTSIPAAGWTGAELAGTGWSRRAACWARASNARAKARTTAVP